MGWVGIAWSARGLLALTLPQLTEDDALARLSERMNKWRGSKTPSEDGETFCYGRASASEAALRPLIERWGLEGISDDPVLDDLKARLQRYFAGERVAFDDPLDPTVGTPFQRRVWAATREIPYGETRSYRWMACRIGSPGAARAVGQALAANPFPIVVPCHRVIRSDGDLGGFGSRPELKRRLLEMEARRCASPGSTRGVPLVSSSP